MSPTIVLDDKGRPVLTLGAAGGPKIISQVVLAICNVVDLGDDLPTAVARPRVHHQWRPDRAWVEQDLDPAVVARLTALGHDVELSGPGGATQAIGIDLTTTPPTFIPVSDPRVQGSAAVTSAAAK